MTESSHPSVIIHRVTDLSPEDLEHLARSNAMSGTIGDRDRQDVIDALRRLAAIEKAQRRHPAGDLPGHAEDTTACECA